MSNTGYSGARPILSGPGFTGADVSPRVVSPRELKLADRGRPRVRACAALVRSLDVDGTLADTMNARPVIFRSATCILVLLPSLVAGTVWHEVVGHGLTAVLLGGRMTYLEVMGIELWPEVGWIGWPDVYGQCGVENLPTPTRQSIVDLGGSASTWIVSLAATVLLCLRHRDRAAHPRWARPLLIGLAIWWIDLFTYTLPTWGVRRSVLWGGTVSEPHQAAVALGIPGWAYQVFVIISSAALAAALVTCLRRGQAPPVERLG